MENASPKLIELRKLMAEHKLDAYIIPHNDAHSVFPLPIHAST